MKSCLDCPKGNYHKIRKRNLQKVKTQVRTLHTKFHNYRACKSSSDCIVIEDAASSFCTYILPFMVHVLEKFFALAFCLVSHKSRFLAWVKFLSINFFFHVLQWKICFVNTFYYSTLTVNLVSDILTYESCNDPRKVISCNGVWGVDNARLKCHLF